MLHQLLVEVHWYRSPNFPNTALAREVFVAKTACARKLAIFRVLRSDRVRQFFNPNGVAPESDTAMWQSCGTYAFVISHRERDSRRSIVLRRRVCCILSNPFSTNRGCLSLSDRSRVENWL